MWRVVTPRSHEDNGTTLLSSEMIAPPAAANHPATHLHQQQHHSHWPHSHHAAHYPLTLPLPPPPPPPSVQQQHAYHHGQHEQQPPQDSEQQQQQSHQQRTLKRALSDSDCDDVFSEESGKEPCNSPGDDSCQHTSRKRRRGMIEKKRRDRINASLGELRRLVPAAARDPHSGKLEKAEILQLTVEHLRTLRNKGAEGYDSTKLAMDYHAVGWGECAAEVGRYLVTMEGLDERDPLRLRLLSHLQSFHRDSQSSTATSSPGGNNQQQQQQQQQQQVAQAPPAASSYDQAAVIAASSSAAAPPPPALAWPPAQYPHGQYPHGQYAQHQQHGKPYRPWGAELNAY